MALPANIKPDWKYFHEGKHSSFIFAKEKSMATFRPIVNVTKLFSATEVPGK
jgi:hypothetical protein